MPVVLAAAAVRFGHAAGGRRQISAGSKPLYTFVQDEPGKITGDGFKDDFAGKAFTWHVVLAGGGQSDGGSATSTGGGYGY